MIGTAGEVSGADLDRITRRVFLTTRPQRSSFWTLLLLAAVIAGAGLVADSVATVIGAMIVAPLMTPILGTAVALVLSDQRKALASVALVLAGATVVVAVAYLLGLIVPGPVIADTNTQVAARVSPKLIDLVAALATGGVGAFALVRADVSDALPGVAIAISLVPPLSVVGLTLESGRPGEAWGALLMFATNVTAIIATGTIVLLGYRVRAAAVAAGHPVGRLRARTIAVVFVLLAAVAVPLYFGSQRALRDQLTVATARPVVERWAKAESWEIADIVMRQGALQIAAVGTPPEPGVAALRRALDQAGLGDLPARVSLVMGGFREVPLAGPAAGGG